MWRGREAGEVFFFNSGITQLTGKVDRHKLVLMLQITINIHDYFILLLAIYI